MGPPRPVLSVPWEQAGINSLRGDPGHSFLLPACTGRDKVGAGVVVPKLETGSILIPT